jgi:hypothetical protein
MRENSVRRARGTCQRGPSPWDVNCERRAQRDESATTATNVPTRETLDFRRRHARGLFDPMQTEAQVQLSALSNQPSAGGFQGLPKCSSTELVQQ